MESLTVWRGGGNHGAFLDPARVSPDNWKRSSTVPAGGGIALPRGSRAGPFS